jgi:two-component system sensor histidine kinase PilS (NtrC family)
MDVRGVGDAQAACDAMQPRCPDVVLLRTSQARVGGDIASLKWNAPNCAIIVLTEEWSARCERVWLGMGAQDVVPMEKIEELPGIVSRAIPRARAHAPAWESHERLGTIFQATSSGVLVAGPEGVILDANSAALSYLRLKDRDQLLGRRISEAIPSAEPLLQPSPRGELRSVSVVLPSGTTRVLGFSCLETPSCRTRITVFRDVTRLVQAEERRRRAEQLAQVGELAARLGHEIKNPLTCALVGLSLVESASGLPSHLRDIVQTSLEELRSAAHAINELLSNAKVTSLAPQIVAIVPLVYDAIDPYRGYAARKGVQLRIDELSDPEIWVAADSAWLHRAFTNLLVNAVEACSRGGNVTVCVRLLSSTDCRCRYPGFPGHVVSIQVSDDGDGIPEDLIQSIFRPFFTTKTGGTGLGLAVALDVVEMHGGLMDVVSVAGSGATFEIVLPLVDPMAKEAQGGRTWPCGERPAGIAHGCWIFRGNAERARKGRWPEPCRSCDVFQRTNLALFGKKAPTEAGEE